MGVAAAEALYLQQLLNELGIPDKKPIIIGEDNQACLSIATTTMTSFRTRHIRVEFHFIRDAIQRGDLLVEYVSSASNPADMFTKPLNSSTFIHHRSTIMGQ